MNVCTVVVIVAMGPVQSFGLSILDIFHFILHLAIQAKRLAPPDSTASISAWVQASRWKRAGSSERSK